MAKAETINSMAMKVKAGQAVLNRFTYNQ